MIKKWEPAKKHALLMASEETEQIGDITSGYAHLHEEVLKGNRILLQQVVSIKRHEGNSKQAPQVVSTRPCCNLHNREKNEDTGMTLFFMEI